MSEAERAPLSRPRRVLIALKPVASLACVALAFWVVDTRALLALLGRADLRWVLAALALTAITMLAQAVRWSFTARRLGLRLGLGEALAECYLGGLLNQLLPTGYAGEAARVLRLADSNRTVAQARVRAFLAVLVERLAGQAVLWALIALSVPAWLGASGQRALWATFGAAAVGLAVLLARRGGKVLVRVLGPSVSPHSEALQAALLRKGAWSVHLGTSLVVVIACLALYYCSMRALSFQLAPWTFIKVAPLVLAATSLPISFAGWGPREVASAALFSAAGLDAAAGTAVSVIYGLLALLSTLPGALAWLRPARQATEG